MFAASEFTICAKFQGFISGGGRSSTENLGFGVGRRSGEGLRRLANGFGFGNGLGFRVWRMLWGFRVFVFVGPGLRV